MVKPVYIPSDPSQTALIASLHLSKVAQVSVEAGEAGDGVVDVVIEHTLDHVKKPCVDRYTAKLDVNAKSIEFKKTFCEGYSPSSTEKKPEIITYKGDKARWYTLQSLFLPDAKGSEQTYHWNIARIALTRQQDTTFLWSFANPRMDPLRKLWSLQLDDFSKSVEEEAAKGLQSVKLPPAKESVGWHRFAQFLFLLEERLQKVLEREKEQPAVQQAGVLLAKLYTQSPNPPLVQLDAVVDSLKEWKEKVAPEIRTILFSEYPFLTEVYRDEATEVVTEWLVRRLLFEAASKAPKSEPQPLDINLDLGLGSVRGSDDFQKELRTFLFNPNATIADIERLQLAYAAVTWVGEAPNTGFVDIKKVTDYFESSKVQFDKNVSLPLLQKIAEEQLEGEERDFVLKRVHTLVRVAYNPRLRLTVGRINAAQLPFSWTSAMGFDVKRSKEKVLVLKETPKDTLEKGTLPLVWEKIKGPIPDSKKPYFLTTPDAFAMLDDLQRRREMGLTETFIRPLILGLLTLGEGPYLGMETEARQALTMVLNGVPMEESEIELPPLPPVELALAPITPEEPQQIPPAALAPVPPLPTLPSTTRETTPFYKKGWVWGATAGGAAVIGGVLYFLLGGSEPTKPPVKIPPQPGKDDRTVPTEVGP